MLRTAIVRTTGLALATLIGAASATAQNPVHNHIGHAADAFNGTPNGQGLLPTAIAEAEIAAQHAALAARDLSNLDGAKRHMGHVLHALDPSIVTSGPGLGYGALRAAEGTVRHIELAAGSDEASVNVTTHANHVTSAANHAAMNAGRAIELAQQIQQAEEAEGAAMLIEELAALTRAIASGVDMNEDGRIGWQAGEGGLAQANQHLTLMKRGEGLD